MKKEAIYLITRGDDCGSNTTANRGILEACEHGILKNVSFMVNCPAIEEAVEMFRHKKEICFGLHANITAEWDTVRWGPILPPAKVPTLVDSDGHFFQTHQELRDNKPSVAEIMLELQAQLDRARQLGLKISYVDMHMFFGVISKEVMQAFSAWCRKEGLINFLNVHQNLPKIDAEGDPIEQLIARLDAVTPGVYTLVAHPAYDNQEMRSLGHTGFSGEQVAQERDWERRYFTDQRILKYCQIENVIPIRYDQAK